MGLFGFVSRKECAQWKAAPPFLPAFHFHEIHTSAALPQVRPEQMIAALAALDMRADPVADALLTLRELPAKLARLPGRRRRDAAPAPFGFDAFTGLRRTDHELTLGLAGRFWRPDLGIVAVADAAAFQRFDHPGVAKLVLRFQVIEGADSACTLRTETFVHCPSRATRILFTPYWLMIRLASGWIRRRTLLSIQKTFSTGAC
ncbi:hypothetical protein [Janthinobacterium sp.]|uniref:hypothetical protein n=1 Tax=Janthinobacterium sp. TaxID=1871054 RepID=UPI00293D69F7|nr:hypothetical protein [Janthinobacterium sp.]